MGGTVISRDGSIALLPSNRHVLVVDTTTGEVRAVFGGHEAVRDGALPEVSSVALSTDATWAASTAQDRTAWVWRVDDPARSTRLDMPEADASQAVFSPDSDTIAYVDRAAPTTVTLWDFAADAVRMVKTSHPDDIRGLGWSEDGRLLATASTQDGGEPQPTPDDPRDRVEIHDVRDGGRSRVLTLPLR